MNRSQPEHAHKSSSSTTAIDTAISLIHTRCVRSTACSKPVSLIPVRRTAMHYRQLPLCLRRKNRRSFFPGCRRRGCFSLPRRPILVASQSAGRHWRALTLYPKHTSHAREKIKSDDGSPSFCAEIVCFGGCHEHTVDAF